MSRDAVQARLTAADLHGKTGRRLTFVPLEGVRVGPEILLATVSKAQVDGAPSIDRHGGNLSQADESALYRHYGIDYTPMDMESGRRLVRR